MGVYIKNMEMPKSCWRCTLSQLYEKPREMLVCKITHEEVIRHKIDSNCPLVPVQPHGRLIEEQWLKDAMITTLEALKKNPKMDRQEMHLIAAFDTLRAMVEDAPTIIPAEEGE